MNYELQRYGTWDDAATPIPDFPVPQTPTETPAETLDVIEPFIDPNGWHWYPDANGQLFTLYFDAEANECMLWQLQDDDSFYWRCANVGYICRDIGIENRRGIFFENHLVGTMTLDENLSVVWLPETYINNQPTINEINNDFINNEINWLNNINFANDIIDLSEDDYDP